MPGAQGPFGRPLGRPVALLGHQPSPPGRSARRRCLATTLTAAAATRLPCPRLVLPRPRQTPGPPPRGCRPARRRATRAPGAAAASATTAPVRPRSTASDRWTPRCLCGGPPDAGKKQERGDRDPDLGALPHPHPRHPRRPAVKTPPPFIPCERPAMDHDRTAAAHQEIRRPLHAAEPQARMENLSCHSGHRLVADLARDTRQRGRRSWQPPGSRAP
jgi:hypothetical protein